MLHFVKEAEFKFIIRKKKQFKSKRNFGSFTLVNSIADDVEYFLKIMNFYVRLIQILKMKLN